MQALEAIPHDALQAVKFVFTDIDGTLTDQGKLGARAYDALWQLHDAGFSVVPVTGRPAGWCDLIARQWPVAAVVGENGAFAVWESDGARLRMLQHPKADSNTQQKLDAVRAAVLSEIEGSRVARDQPFRRYDLAIDFCEEPPDLGLEAAVRIRAVFERFGAHAKVSNIHVNGWFGDYDKLSMVQILAAELWQLDDAQLKTRAVFCGDSPNDVPMFAHFPLSVAVANIHACVSELETLPAYVTQGAGGAGFVQLANTLLRGS